MDKKDETAIIEEPIIENIDNVEDSYNFAALKLDNKVSESLKFNETIGHEDQLRHSELMNMKGNVDVSESMQMPFDSKAALENPD